MSLNFDHYFNILNDIYENSHKTAYVRSSAKNQQYLIRYNSHLFSRWYHSTMLRGTLLSPANLLYLMNTQFIKNDYIYPVPNIKAQPKTPYSITLTPIRYNLEHHPVVADFRVFLDSIAPVVTLDAQNFLALSDENMILKKVSINDPFYIEYFLSLAIRMRLIKKIKGVHINRISVTDNLDDFLLLSDREIFNRIVEESIKMCSFYVKNMIPGYEMPIDEEFIEGLLKEPVSTKDIISKIYNVLLDSFHVMLSKGIEFEITSPQFDTPQRSVNMSEHDIYQLFNSGSYVLNALFIKYFFSTFGDFLRLIEPFYEDPFTFKEFQKCVSEDSSNADSPFFIPCSHYSLTPLCMEFYNISVDPDRNKVINTKIPISSLFNILPGPYGKSQVTPSSLIAKYAKPSNIKAYRLKITLAQDEEMWKIIELTDICTLEQLHHIICDEFFLEPSENYFFNTDKSMNIFTKYTSPSDKSMYKKTNRTILKTLPLDEKGVFYYCLERSFSPFIFRENNINNEIYLIEIIKIKNPTGIEVYPRVIRESSMLKDFNFFMSPD